MPSLKLGWYNSPNFRPLVRDGKVVEFAGRQFLCFDCAKELGANDADEGRISNITWHSKGYDCGLVDGYRCLCEAEIEEGIEVWLTVRVEEVL